MIFMHDDVPLQDTSAGGVVICPAARFTERCRSGTDARRTYQQT